MNCLLREGKVQKDQIHNADIRKEDENGMYLIERQKKILTLLLTSKEWITGAEIARRLGITDRTVRKDIRDINEELKKYPNCYIESIRGTGYLLRTADRDALFNRMEGGSSSETPRARIAHLALEILESEDPISLEDLEDEFFISRTTLEAAIRQINDTSTAKGVGAVIRHRKNAVQAECTEREKRELMRSFLFITKEDMGRKMQDEYGFLNAGDIRRIMGKVRGVLVKHKLKVTDRDMTEIVLWLYIQKQRLLSGEVLREQEGAGREEKTIPETIRILSEEMTKSMQEGTELLYPKEEIVEFAEYLGNIRLMKEERFTKKEIMNMVEPCYIVIVEELLNDIKSRFMIDFTQDEALFADLVMHIRFSIRTSGGTVSQEASLLDTIKDRYPFVFELSTYIFGRIWDVLGIEMDEVQLGYVAAHLGAALERLENTDTGSDFKIAVCSNMSMGIVRLLMAKLHSVYRGQISIAGPYPLYEMEDMMKGQPGLILTTYLYGVFDELPVPVIPISPMLESADIQAINEKIKSLKQKTVVLSLEQGIEQYFERELFFPGMEMESREEVLEFLSSKIVEKGYAPTNLLEDIMERERIAPTTFSNYMAMPHPIHMCAYKTVIAVATLKKGVVWGKQKQVVRLVFLLIVRSKDMKYISGFFDITAKLVTRKKKVQTLLETEDFEKFIGELVPM